MYIISVNGGTQASECLKLYNRIQPTDVAYLAHGGHNS